LNFYSTHKNLFKGNSIGDIIKNSRKELITAIISSFEYYLERFAKLNSQETDYE
jgi:hypothetical protein